MPAILLTLHRFVGALLLIAATVLASHAQTINTVKFDPPAGIGTTWFFSELIPAAGGGWWMPGTVTWSPDSMYLNLLHLSPGLTIRHSRQARLTSWQANFGSYAATTTALYSGGNAISGSGGARGHHLFSFDTTLATRWGIRFTNLHNGDGSFYGLYLQGPDTLVMYTSTGASANLTFHRTWGRAFTGTGWRSRLVTASVGVALRNRVLAHGPAETHYLAGSTGGNSGGAIVKLDTTKAYWGRSVTAGGIDESFGPAFRAANGNVWVILSTQPLLSTPDQAVLCQFDTAGTLLNSRRLILANNRWLGISSVKELPGGELLLGGFSSIAAGSTRHPILAKLTATGAVAWVRRWDLGASGRGGPATLVPWPGGGYRLSVRNMAVVELDANFNACNFLDEPAGALNSAPDNTITVTPLTLTMTPFTPTWVPETLLPRTIPFTRTLVCSAMGTDEEPTTASLSAWPQPLPRGAALHLTLPAGWATATTRLTLTSALGQEVWRGAWAESVVLPANLAVGCWTLTVSGPRGLSRRHRLLLE